MGDAERWVKERARPRRAADGLRPPRLPRRGPARPRPAPHRAEIGAPRFEVAEALEKAALAELQGAQARPRAGDERRVLVGGRARLRRGPAELFTPMFTCARVAGWSAHILEQKREARLIRPTAPSTSGRRRAGPVAERLALGAVEPRNDSRRRRPPPSAVGRTFVGLALVGRVLVAVVTLNWVTAFKLMGPGQVCVVQEGGPFDGRDVAEVRQAASGVTNIGVFNKQRCFPATERNYIISAKAGESGRQEIDFVEVPTRRCRLGPDRGPGALPPDDRRRDRRLLPALRRADLRRAASLRGRPGVAQLPRHPVPADPRQRPAPGDRPVHSASSSTTPASTCRTPSRPCRARSR